MVHIYYGDGKGKTSAALGLVLRASSRKLPVLIIRFLKNPGVTGEDELLSKFMIADLVYPSAPTPLFPGKSGKDAGKKAFEAQVNLFRSIPDLVKKKNKVVILDEALDLVRLKLIRSRDLTDLFKKIGPGREIVATGHYMDRELERAADLVTEMKKVKHYFDRNLKARKGVEY
jgi:cob(I)alamin adenosyltransferase